MKKAWSLLWLIVAATIVLQMVAAMLQPYWHLIGGILAVVVVIVIVVNIKKIKAAKRTNRRHF